MPGRFTVLLTPSFKRDLEELPSVAQDKGLESIKRLEVNPFGPQPKIKKLQEKGISQWRLEALSYRVRNDVIGQEVALYRVRHRKEIYRD